MINLRASPMGASITSVSPLTMRAYSSSRRSPESSRSTPTFFLATYGRSRAPIFLSRASLHPCVSPAAPTVQDAAPLNHLSNELRHHRSPSTASQSRAPCLLDFRLISRELNIPWSMHHSNLGRMQLLPSVTLSLYLPSLFLYIFMYVLD